MGGDGKWPGIQTHTRLRGSVLRTVSFPHLHTGRLVSKIRQCHTGINLPEACMLVFCSAYVSGRPSMPPVNKHCSEKAVTTSILFRI